MAQQGLDIAPPPRKTKTDTPPKTTSKKSPTVKPDKVANDKGRAVTFDQLAEGNKVQFNKRVTQATADGFEMLSIKTKKRVPDLLAEGLELLEAKYGKV